MVRAGKLRRRVTLQAPVAGTENQNALGEPVPSWAAALDCWASIEPLSGKELWQAQQVQADVSHKVTLRFQRGVTAAWRVLYQGRVFNILYVINLEEQGRTLQLMCVEQV